MATIDIRKQEGQVVTEIVFSDNNHNACTLKNAWNTVAIESKNGHCAVRLVITNKEDAENLILALKKSIELGWFE